MISRYLDSVSAAYRALLRLFPSDLRNQYGDEMASDFTQLIQEEYERCGARGVALVCGRAFGEFFTIALPRHFKSNWMIAATLSLVITSCVLGSLVGIMTERPLIMHVAVHGCR